MALAVDSKLFVLYDVGGPYLWHERSVLAACGCGEGWHIVLTPDYDIFPEQVSMQNDELAGFRLCPAGGGLPHGVTAASSYRFSGQPAAAMLAQFKLDAAYAAAAMGGGLVAPGAAPVAVAAAAVPGAVPNWVYVETKAGFNRGAQVVLDGSEVVRGEVGLKLVGVEWVCIRDIKVVAIAVYKGAEVAGDARLLPVKLQNMSREERTWRDVSSEVSEVAFPDWAVPGPRSTQWCVRFLNRRNGGPLDHHRWWVSNLGLKGDAWGTAEHETLMKVLDKLGRYDGLDLSNLAGAEVAFRRCQLIEFFYSDRGPGGSSGGKGGGKGNAGKEEDGLHKMEPAIFLGSHREFRDTMVAPELMDYVSKEVEREASVMKQVRKAREERVASKK
jgi:hypothetical protein